MNEILEKNPDLNIEEFISPEDRGRMQEGLTRIKESFANAPPEVEACVEASLPGIVAKVKAGTLEQKDMIKIGRRLGEVMPACFQKAFSGGEGGFPDGPGGFPGDPGGHGGPGADQIQKCLAEAGVAPNTPPNKEQESKIRECAQRMSQQGREGRQGGEGGFPGGGATGGEFPGGGRTSGQFPGGGPGGFPGGLPSDAVQKCQAEAGIGAGAPPGPDAIQKMQDCISRSVQGERGLNQGTKEGKDEHSEPGLRRENRLPDGGSQFPGNQGAQGQSPEAIRKNIEEQQKQGIQQHEVQKRIEEETRRQIEERTRQFQGGQGGLPQGLDPRSSLPGGFGQPGQPGGFSGGQQPGGFPTGQPGSFPGSGPAGDHQGGFPGGGAPQQGPGPGGNGPTQGPGPSGPGPGAGGGHQGFNPPSLLNFFAQILFGVAF